jgi:hypothetical protein
MSAWMQVDARALGPRVLDFYAASLDRGLAARDAGDPERFFDVSHDEVAAEPVAVAERIYRRFGRPFAGAARDRIEQYARAHPKGEHGEHVYALDDYGLTPEIVRRRFAAYTDRFGALLTSRGGER